MNKGGDNINFTRNNAQVIEQQQVPNPMVQGQYFTNMTEILWSDGAITFGCLICGEQVSSRPSLSIHIGKAHNNKIIMKAVKAKRKRVYTKRNADYWANGGNIINIKKTTNNTLADKELEFWKAQAHRAEAENRKLKAQIKALLNIK
jgi:uncharacterized C2H2 Zn-finger protein